MSEAWKWTLEGGVVGDWVVVERGGDRTLHHITKTTKTSVTLEDGSRWTWMGQGWGAARSTYMSWSQPAAYLVTNVALAQARVQDSIARAALQKGQLRVYHEISDHYRTLTQAQVDAILGVLMEGGPSAK